jgi:inorganic pyrophosphatase
LYEYYQIEIGSDAPYVINVIIEIPAASSPVKYEIEKVFNKK